MFNGYVVSCCDGVFVLLQFIPVAFWTLFNVDRELIYPKSLDEIIPLWLNHFMVGTYQRDIQLSFQRVQSLFVCVQHTFIGIFVLVEILIIRHEYPHIVKGCLQVATFDALYLSWYDAIKLTGPVVLYSARLLPLLGFFGYVTTPISGSTQCLAVCHQRGSCCSLVYVLLSVFSSTDLEDLYIMYDGQALEKNKTDRLRWSDVLLLNYFEFVPQVARLKNVFQSHFVYMVKMRC